MLTPEQQMPNLESYAASRAGRIKQHEAATAKSDSNVHRVSATQQSLQEHAGWQSSLTTMITSTSTLYSWQASRYHNA